MSVNSIHAATKPAVAQHGVAHATPATRQIHALAFGTAKATGTKKRRTKKASSSSSSSSRPRKARSSSSGLVKGSSAAKAHMAALRKLRGKGTKKAKKAA